MSRPHKDTDFTITLPGVGDFTFARRTMGDAMRIRGRYLRLMSDAGSSDDAPFDAELSGYANVIATITTLLVKAPDARWSDPEAIDLLDNPDAASQMVNLFSALQEQEDSFRRPAEGLVKA